VVVLVWWLGGWTADRAHGWVGAGLGVVAATLGA
jgi:hypothetical protein